MFLVENSGNWIFETVAFSFESVVFSTFSIVGSIVDFSLLQEVRAAKNAAVIMSFFI